VHALTQLVNGLSRYPLTRGARRWRPSRRSAAPPEFFRLYLSRHLAYASEGSAAALAHTRAEVYDTTLQRTWQSLPPLDRAALQLIARGVTDVFFGVCAGWLISAILLVIAVLAVNLYCVGC
jgi:uncharacterized membrane protein